MTLIDLNGKVLGGSEVDLEDLKEIESVSRVRKILEVHIADLGSKEKPAGTLVVLHDITSLKHLQKVRRDFVANILHELRSALGAIRRYVENPLENDALEQKRAKEFLQTIMRHTNRSSRLIEDLLIISRLKSIESDIKLEEIGLPRLIQEVVQSFGKVKEMSNIELRTEIQENLAEVKGLTAEIETALENLIDNAFEYGAAGKVSSIAAKELDTEVQVDVCQLRRSLEISS
ncbi:MAG: sensor histidine kinase [bacterium]